MCIRDRRGIGGGGALFSASISPIDKNEIYLSCDMSELFHSKDFGNNWTFVHYNQIQSNNTRSVVRFTNDPKIQYTINWSGNDVATPVRTNDGGENWKKLNNDPTNGEAFTLWADPHSTPVSYTHPDAADERSSVDLGGRRIIKKKKIEETKKDEKKK